MKTAIGMYNETVRSILNWLANKVRWWRRRNEELPSTIPVRCKQCGRSLEAVLSKKEGRIGHYEAVCYDCSYGQLWRAEDLLV